MLPMALHQIGLCVVFCINNILATPVFDSPREGSTDEEEFGNLTTFLPISSLSSDYQTTPVSPTHVEKDIFSQAMMFLKENMLLILVAATFIILLSLIISGAIYMSRRQKVNAYYPSSFPSKMYVDHRDKTGGAKLFNEVSENPTPGQESGSVDSHKQLQQDIMRAAKSLRTPNKSVDAAEESDLSQKVADHNPEASSKPNGSVLDQPILSLPEEKEQSDLSNSEVAATATIPQPSPPEQSQPEDDSEQLYPEKDDSLQPLTGRSLRPSSLHIHNDSATLQLIAGEKTAF
ncbi:Transmembrane protein 119 Osteoblast induction factor [Channa argus]|uniref:Transmembrane protein 119 Osteoblast induction factor n=2 Tax=Channa argus TaxID=215402 RepID=A0A6G1QIX9_CHAAH|nr:Transmembrane protein 119 Osteoblast induction factor [Channa argus]